MNLKKIISISLLCLLIQGVYAQVGINTDSPNEMSSLDIVSGNTGVLIPRLTEEQRDALTPSETENSLMIYNTTENCYNFWNQEEAEWKSVCGQLGKSQFTFDCATVTVQGTYVEGKDLAGNNYLSVKVNVTKPGSYEITGKTDNGYGFTTSGTFLSAGEFTVQIPGQGTPALVQEDVVSLAANGTEIDCSENPVTVNVLTAAGTYTMNCGNAKVYGIYKLGTELSAANNYIDVPINATIAGSWSITSDAVDGISFSGSGTLSGSGAQTVRIYGTGSPTSTNIKKMTLTSNSGGGVTTTCTVDVIVVIPKKKVLVLGDTSTYGYNFSVPNTQSNQLVTSTYNFGVNDESTFKAEGFEFVRPNDAWANVTPTLAQVQQIKTYLLTDKVDICVLTHNLYAGTTGLPEVISEYLNAGGVVIAFIQNNGTPVNLFRTIFGNEDINGANVNVAGAFYKMSNVDDMIVNGPFGDMRGKYWGEDSSATLGLTNLPLGEIDVYSTGFNYSSNTANSGSVTGFKHKRLNFVWFGDAGFLSGDTGTTMTACPFKNTSSPKYEPKSKPGFGNGATKGEVFNAHIFANTMAWALYQAEYNGINSK